MRFVVKRLLLGLVLIISASAALLLSDLGRRTAVARTVPHVGLLQHASTMLLDEGTRGAIDGLAKNGFVLVGATETRLSSRSQLPDWATIHPPSRRCKSLVAPLLANKLINTGSDGKVTVKAESLASAKATKYDSVAYDDVKVTAFGGTAIATGDFKAKGTDASGKPLDVHERFTDTWVKMPNGQWQCVASHQSLVKM